MTWVEVDVWIRDTETNEVIKKILSGSFKLEPKHKLEIWVDDRLKHEEEGEEE